MRNKTSEIMDPAMYCLSNAAIAANLALPNRVNGWRHRAIALAAVAAVMPVWAQGTLDARSYPLNLPPLDSGNSNLPRSTPGVLAAKLGRIDYASNAQVGLLRVLVAQSSLPADGQTPARLAITVLDFNGQLLKGEAVVTVEVSAGRLQIPGAATDELNMGRKDVDRISRGTQLRVKDGRAEILLIAPAQPQDVTVRFTAGKAQAQGVISFVPELREMLAVGLVEGIIRFDGNSPLQLSGARREDGFEREIRKFSSSSDDGKVSGALRTAFFLKGKIKGDALLTMAYDSDKETYERLFRSVRPDDYYAVYGDASVRGFDAQSRSSLYVRIDKEKSYLLWGDFNTGDGFSKHTGGGNVTTIRKRELGNYSRSMNGARVHYDMDGVLVNGFVTKDTLVQLIEEFAGQGISGPFAVSKRDAVSGSEKLEIVTRDRNQPTVILAVEALQRYSDYSFEPFSGRILLNQPLPTVDANGNPKSLRVTYEVDSGGDDFWVYGVDAQVAVGEAVEVGGSYVEDKNPYAPYTLASANASFKLGDNTTIVAEVARSKSVLGGALGGSPYSLQPAYGQPVALNGQLRDVEGQAWRLEALHRDDTTQARFYYGHSDPNFNNPAASLTQGREEGALKVTRRVSEQWSAYLEGTLSKNQVADASRTALSVGAVYAVTPALDIDLALTHTREEAGDYAGALLSLGSGLLVDPQSGIGSYGSNLINPQTGYGFDGGNYGLAGVSYSSTGLRLRSTYRVTEQVDLIGELEQGIAGDTYNRAAVGAAYRFSELGRLYGKYEKTTGLSSPQAVNGIYESDAFVFGLDTQYLPNQRMFSEYRMRDAFSGDQLQWANGLRNAWNLSETVKISTSAEYLHVYRGQTQNAYALTGAAEWRPDDLWLLGGRLEWRRLLDRDVIQQSAAGALSPAIASTLLGSDTWLSTLTAARKINRDWTFLGRNYLLYTDNRGHMGDRWEDKLQLGMAYRDTDTNRLNTLARYEYWVQRDQSSNTNHAQTAEGLDGAAGNATTSDGFDKHIVSLHAAYHPSRPWWLGARAAAKWQRDYFNGESDVYSAYLLSGRSTYDLSKHWDVSALASVMYSPQGSSVQHAVGIEAGYQIQDNLWLSAGYNVRGFSDRDLSGGDYTNQGIYIRIRFKFDEDLFGGRDAVRNPALDRK